MQQSKRNQIYENCNKIYERVKEKIKILSSAKKKNIKIDNFAI